MINLSKAYKNSIINLYKTGIYTIEKAILKTELDRIEAEELAEEEEETVEDVENDVEE